MAPRHRPDRRRMLTLGTTGNRRTACAAYIIQSMHVPAARTYTNTCGSVRGTVGAAGRSVHDQQQYVQQRPAATFVRSFNSFFFRLFRTSKAVFADLFFVHVTAGRVYLPTYGRDRDDQAQVALGGGGHVL